MSDAKRVMLGVVLAAVLTLSVIAIFLAVSFNLAVNLGEPSTPTTLGRIGPASVNQRCWYRLDTQWRQGIVRHWIYDRKVIVVVESEISGYCFEVTLDDVNFHQEVPPPEVQ